MINKLLESLNQTMISLVPVVVLFMLWPQLSRVEKQLKTTSTKIEQVEQKLDIIEQTITNRIGKEKWQEIQSQLNQ